MINRMELFNANNSKAMCIFYHGIDLFQNILLALLKKMTISICMITFKIQ